MRKLIAIMFFVVLSVIPAFCSNDLEISCKITDKLIEGAPATIAVNIKNQSNCVYLLESVSTKDLQDDSCIFSCSRYGALWLDPKGEFIEYNEMQQRATEPWFYENALLLPGQSTSITLKARIIGKGKEVCVKAISLPKGSEGHYIYLEGSSSENIFQRKFMRGDLITSYDILKTGNMNSVFLVPPSKDLTSKEFNKNIVFATQNRSFTIQDAAKKLGVDVPKNPGYFENGGGWILNKDGKSYIVSKDELWLLPDVTPRLLFIIDTIAEDSVVEVKLEGIAADKLKSKLNAENISDMYHPEGYYAKVNKKQLIDLMHQAGKAEWPFYIDYYYFTTWRINIGNN